MLPNVKVLGALPSADDVVSPLDARSVVLVHRSRGCLAKLTALLILLRADLAADGYEVPEHGRKDVRQRSGLIPRRSIGRSSDK